MSVSNTKPGKELEAGLALRDCASALVIYSQEQYDMAAEFLVGVKTKMKEVESAMDPQCKAAYSAWQVMNEQKKKYLAPYVEAEGIIKKTLSDYQLEQRRIAEDARQKAEEDARKAEEKLKKKLIKQGREEEAGMVFVPVVAPEHAVTKAEGVSTASDFDIDITNIQEFLKWIPTSGLDLASVLSVKIAPIKQFVKLTKTARIPGCQITEKINVSARSRN